LDEAPYGLRAPVQAQFRRRQWNQHPARPEKADEGVGCGPGGPPHN
jgi:hypothetical protein